MLLLVVIWGLNFPIVKIALRVMPPLVFNALRFAGATAILLTVLRSTEGSQPILHTGWMKLFALGFVGHALYQILFISGLARTTAGNSSLILAMVPLFVAMLGAALKIDRVTAKTWTGIVLAFAGLFLLTGSRGGIAFGGATWLGDILMLLCTVCWASYTVFSRPFLRSMSPLRLTALSMAMGMPVLVVAALPQLIRQPWQEVTWQAWAALGYSTILAIAVGYIIWYSSVQAVGGTRTAIYSNLIPVVALASSWVLLGETLGILQAIGAAVVLAGVSLART